MFCEPKNTKELLAQINNIQLKDDEYLALLIGEQCPVDLEEMIESLNKENIPFFGGIFPGVTNSANKSFAGVIITTFPLVQKPYLIKGLKDKSFQLEESIVLSPYYPENKYTALILVDGLAQNISYFLEEVFGMYADTVNYIGGGAGSLSLEQKPCLFTNEGFFADGAIIVFTKLSCSLGVRHGWKKIWGPLVATRAEKNIIKKLNWENAFNIYRTIVEKDSGKVLTQDNFFDIAKGYPFGLIKKSSELIVRDPIAVQNNSDLICVGEVPENAVLNILKGSPDTLKMAASIAAEESFSLNKSENINLILMVDCISRVLFLEDGFSDELKAVNTKLLELSCTKPPCGILTLGEISSTGDGFLEFFNKTIVVGAFYDTQRGS